MMDAAEQLFNSLNSYKELENIISAGDSEGLFLECKSPCEPRLNKDLKSHLAKAISGFSNTAGGVIIWGISTTRHQHSGLDVLSQIEPIAHCKNFVEQVNRSIPALTTPTVVDFKTKMLKEKPSDSKGVIITFIPKTVGDPIQSNQDDFFYFRSGDEFRRAPYEMIKRLFSATDSPDLKIVFQQGSITLEKDGSWKIPIVLTNKSSAIGEHVTISINIDNPNSCQSINIESFQDVSDINPGQKVFMDEIKGVIHRGLNLVVGDIKVKMKVGKLPKRKLDLTVNIYANKMRARITTYSIKLVKKRFIVKEKSSDFVY